MPRRADPVDGQIGRRVRAYRIARGLSQTTLGEKVGVTFQQIQKYENGVNRIGGGRLTKIAGVLDVRISALFGDEGNGDDAGVDRLLVGPLSKAYAARLLSAFDAIDDVGQRRALVEFVEAMVPAGAKLPRRAAAARAARRGLQ
jgi:transcriptional regulator with XRE-family HTH domain